jgi:hypothetical protein
MFFKHWKLCDQDLVPLEFDQGRFYYIQAQAWALKGYLGGTHSYCTFWSRDHNSWMVVELTDPETVSYQNCQTFYTNVKTADPTEHSPIITNRAPNARWFGHNPYIVDSCPMTADYKDIVKACAEYPLTGFVLISQNCNTFTSYLIWKLKLNLRRPFRSVGFRSKSWWSAHTL